ncbi:transposase [Streptomyces bauhiniae]|uniref:transposase n=1 Tax=Streptomyces bauhiniae TaxID=2340725 RepID=UPI0036990359
MIDAASLRTKRGTPLTGPNPVDRGKKGSKLHVLSDAQGIPLAVEVSGANLHDSQAFKPLIRGVPAVRSRRGPRRRRPGKLRAVKAYPSNGGARWLLPGRGRAGRGSGRRRPGGGGDLDGGVDSDHASALRGVLCRPVDRATGRGVGGFRQAGVGRDRSAVGSRRTMMPFDVG